MNPTAVLVIHGSGGGYDQGELIAEDLLGEGFQAICPSRFGYLRSTFKEGATFDDQAHAYAALLDHLGNESINEREEELRGDWGWEFLDLKTDTLAVFTADHQAVGFVQMDDVRAGMHIERVYHGYELELRNGIDLTRQSIDSRIS